jgi:hypothetical protein
MAEVVILASSLISTVAVLCSGHAAAPHSAFVKQTLVPGNNLGARTNI